MFPQNKNMVNSEMGMMGMRVMGVVPAYGVKLSPDIEGHDFVENAQSF